LTNNPNKNITFADYLNSDIVPKSAKENIRKILEEQYNDPNILNEPINDKMREVYGGF